MKIGIIGTGYVGLPTGVGLAELGNEVFCIDNDVSKIEILQSGKPTIFEDGLDEMLLSNIRSGRLKFTTSMREGVENADVVILAVGTPPHPVTKEADMCYIHAAAEELAPYLQGYTVIATKSTVPVGTGDEVEKIIRSRNPRADFDVVSLPEFLREGFAVHDFFNPDRIVIGANSAKAKNLLKELYKPFEGKTEILFVRRRSSETIKYASNAFLAMKIHYINEMANFCEKAGADLYEVAKGMGLDNRIGGRFLNPGPGYGGSCFPKDTNAMACMGKKYGAPLRAIFPGRCFRNESIDACHENTFFQMEGIMIDENISISNLIYFMKTMLSEVFGRPVEVRLRPGFFPFVEPGFELDIKCLICGGDGCNKTKKFNNNFRAFGNVYNVCIVCWCSV